MERRRDVFQAIADPTRRGIIELLASQPLTMNAIADYFDTSRPTVSEHVKLLVECGLVVIRKEGRERHCEARLEALSEVQDWVAQYAKAWSKTLDSMESYLLTIGTELKKPKNAKHIQRGKPRNK
ncbi:metalloregulator ArsR/SmtB family transcription factor [Chitinophaga caseinilytica]|uniref:Metalloregulator ArsR/SmtB family transcription factor n=1 Tax=Chitinophaga caseinilytica TaxID=2267521 RepID=A0ABZ2Z130_9BACT